MTKLTVAAKINNRASQRQKRVPRARVLAARIAAAMATAHPLSDRCEIPAELARGLIEYLKGAADAK